MKYKILICLFQLLLFKNIYAAAFDKRIGAGIGKTTWGGNFLSVSYDQKGLLQPNWTVGGELTFIDKGFFLSPRILFWNKANLSSFYAGPKASIGSINASYYSRSNSGDYNNLFLAAGGEAGWLYRFPINKIDVGSGVDFMATNYGLWLGVKITAGYLMR